MKRVPAALLALALLAGCATVPFGQRPESVAKVIDLINKGDAANLAASSTVPFMFNGEIVELKEDVLTMWTNIAKSGFKIAGAHVLSTGPIDANSAALFGGTLEAKVFLQKYAPKGTAVVRLQSASGTFDLLLDGARQGRPIIVGFAEEGT